MKNINLILITSMLLITFMTSCGHKHTEGDGHKHGESMSTDGVDDDLGHEDQDHGDIHLTREQINTIGLEFGDFTSLKVNDYVIATGTLGLPSNALSSISPRSNGVLHSTKKFVEGNYIKKGEVIASLSNMDFIKMQQAYLEVAAELQMKRAEVNRQKVLIDADAGVSKNLEVAISELAILTAKVAGISKQLSYLGIYTDNLTPENMQQEISISAPISGYISSVNFHNGMYVEPSFSLLDIMSTDHLHLELDVFEKDIAKVKVGQKISYSTPALGIENFKGEVSVIGKAFEVDTKTIRVHGHVEGSNPKFVKDLYINAKIWLNDEAKQALPEAAIINDGGNNYIYVASNDLEAKVLEFEKINVVVEATNNGYSAVKLVDALPKDKSIVTKGAYYVYARSKAGELAHEH